MQEVKKWDDIKLKFIHGKRKNQQIEETTYTMGGIFACYASDTGLVCRIYKKLKNLTKEQVKTGK